MAGGRVARVPDPADPLTGLDAVAPAESRGPLQVRVQPVVGGASAVDDDVVAGAAVLGGSPLNLAAPSRDQGGPAVRHHVLPLVDVPGPRRADPVAVAVRAASRAHPRGAGRDGG